MEHATHSYACRNCEQNGISVPFAKAMAPAPLLGGSLASPSLVAHIAVRKYQCGMPLYRLENGFLYDGVIISRQTMANYLLEESVLYADETVVQVLREPGRVAKAKSYEWLYRTSGCAKHRIVVYEYRETQNREHPRAFLKSFAGLLHTDGYQVYHNLPPGVTVIGCWAHVRRR